MRIFQKPMNISPLIILADRGRVLAYRIEPSRRGKFPRLISATEILEGLSRPSAEETDRAGGFPQGGSNGHANASAERMEAAAERETRCLRRVASEISSVVEKARAGHWSLAAPGEINNAIVDSLRPVAKRQLQMNLPRDLTHLPVEELISHFERHAA